MSESPADEYERVMEERREAARPGVVAAVFLWVVVHGAAILFLASPAGLGGGAIGAGFMLWLGSGVPAIVALVVLVRNWGALSAGQKVACAAPGAVMLAEMGLPAAAVAWRLLG